jgi:predicted ribosomally synthesized peptide with nif11-like leader
MSQSDFQAFIQKISSNSALQAALGERFQPGQDIPAEQLISFAGAQGYSFSVEEAEAELSEEALEGVTGGASFAKISPQLVNTSSFGGLTYSPTTASFNFFVKM